MKTFVISRAIIRSIIVSCFICAALTSCSNYTPDERRVKTAFMDYVKNDFDDPKSLKEIVSIEPSDTVSLQEFIAKVQSSFAIDEQLYKTSDSISKARLIVIHELGLLIRKGKVDRETKEEITELFMEAVNCIKVPPLSLEYWLKDQIDTMKYEAPKYGYIIKFRQKYNGEIKLKQCHFYIDSLTRDVITNLDKLPTAHSQEEFYKNATEYFDIMKDHVENVKTGYINLIKFKSILERLTTNK